MGNTYTNIDEYSFEKLLMKLAQLHEFYFDPNSRDKHEGNEKDKKKKDADIDKFWSSVDCDIKANRFQLNSNDYQYLIPKDKNDWGKNPYYKLYSFLQDKDEWFAKFQTEEAKILWCLFAYVDATSHTEPVKYLFGPSKDEFEKDLNPHFLFRTYHINALSGIFESVESSVIDNVAKAAYYSRKKATKYSDVDFVYVLQSYRKRTDFEFDNDLMYIPSGEMDCCILQWLFLILNDGERRCTINDKMYFEVSKVKNEILHEQHKEFINIPYEEDKTPKGVLEWLQLWGLIQIVSENENIYLSKFKVLPRGLSMLHWMSIYLKAINSNGKDENAPRVFYDEAEPDYWRVLGLRDYMEDGHGDSYYYLKNVLLEKQNEIIDVFSNSNEIDNETASKQFVNLLNLMLAWDEKNNEGSDKIWQTFHKRCRFSTFIHYLVRFGENNKPNSEISNIPTGLLAFPVLWDTITKDGIPQRQPVGVFMSVIQEDIKNEEDDKKHQSCFKDYLAVKDKFEERIAKIRTIINLLAKVENIEVYQRGIRVHQEEERAKQDSLAAIAGSTHFFKSWVNIMLRGKIPDNFKEDIDEVMNIPEMVNLISKVFRESNQTEKEKTLNASTLLRTRTHFGLNAIVNEFQNKTIDNRSISLSIINNKTIETDSSLEFVFNERFYRLLFSTIAENAISNMPGSLNSSIIEIYPLMSTRDKFCGLIFKNKSKQLKSITSEHLQDKKPNKGGLFYFDFFLSATNKGFIKSRFEKKENELWFITILEINELKLN